MKKIILLAIFLLLIGLFANCYEEDDDLYKPEDYNVKNRLINSLNIYTYTDTLVKGNILYPELWLYCNPQSIVIRDVNGAVLYDLKGIITLNQQDKYLIVNTSTKGIIQLEFTNTNFSRKLNDIIKEYE